MMNYGENTVMSCYNRNTNSCHVHGHLDVQVSNGFLMNLPIWPLVLLAEYTYEQVKVFSDLFIILNTFANNLLFFNFCGVNMNSPV